MRLADLHQGDRVRFVRATNPNVANDDLFYEPAVPQGMTATVQKVQRDYALVRLDDQRFFEGDVTLWREGALSPPFTNTVNALEKLKG